MSGSIFNNDYLITPFTDDDEFENKRHYTLEELLINSCKDYLKSNNNGSKIRRLQILSCYSDRDIEYYKTFFNCLFSNLKNDLNLNTPFTHIRILFNKIDFEQSELQKLKRFFQNSKFNGCVFEVRTSSQGSLLHAKTIAINFGDNRKDGLLFCTSANFTRNAFQGKNLEFIHRSENKKSISSFLSIFDDIWQKATINPRFTFDLQERESTSSYLLKGYFLIDAKSKKLPFDYSEEVKFKVGGDSPALKPFLQNLLLTEDSQSKSIKFTLILLESFFGKGHRETITRISNRNNIKTLCSDFQDTYWIMPDTFNVLNEKKNNPFETEVKFYIDTVKALGQKLQNKSEAQKKLEQIISPQLFDLFDVDCDREIFISSILSKCQEQLSYLESITFWELFGLNAIRSNLANYRGEVEEHTLSSIAKGYQKGVSEKFQLLFNQEGTVNTKQSKEFNMFLFDELADKRRESRKQLNQVLVEMSLRNNATNNL